MVVVKLKTFYSAVGADSGGQAECDSNENKTTSHLFCVRTGTFAGVCVVHTTAQKSLTSNVSSRMVGINGN